MEQELNEERKSKILVMMKDPGYKPLKLKELAYLMGVKNEDRGVLRKILTEMVNEGSVEVSESGRYRITERGVFQGHFIGNAKGFGFVEIEGQNEDIFVPAEHTMGALHDDTVLVRVNPIATGKRKEGVITKIITRGFTDIVGTYQANENFGFVVSDHKKFAKDIFIPKEHSKGAVTGHKVVVHITEYGDEKHNPVGKVEEILGHINDPGVDILSIVRAYALPTEYPKLVMKQLETIPDEIDQKDMAGRLDLRNLQTVTIDGEDAKDLDDAITLSKEGDIYKLGVHIADVTNYVTEGSALDKEALKRSTSVYLVDRVIPMLPHKLSNGICSLNHDVDRLALSCLMEIDGKGKVVGHRIAETVLNVDRRMSYTSVNKIIEEEDPTEIEEYRPLVPMFHLMKELSLILRDRRKKRGAIDFDFPESQIILDEKGKPIDIKPHERNVATKIIEDFMLAANETIAEDFFWQEKPFVYRTHEEPSPEKIETLNQVINNFGYYLKYNGESIHPKEFQKLIKNVEGSPEEALISRLTLRSMKQARYTVDCSGHFGLAAKYYCHFTSPIRRYPDLQIHRIIKENLHGSLNDKRMNHYDRILPEVVDVSSQHERRADEAEREVEKLKKAQYMVNHIGEEYEGVVSGLNTWGMYVELPNTVEGMVPVNKMEDDFYYFDEEKYALIGSDTNNEYHLGQSVTIRVDSVDMSVHNIDFMIAGQGMPEDYEGIEDQEEKALNGYKVASKRNGSNGTQARANHKKDNDKKGKGKSGKYPSKDSKSKKSGKGSTKKSVDKKKSSKKNRPE